MKPHYFFGSLLDQIVNFHHTISHIILRLQQNSGVFHDQGFPKLLEALKIKASRDGQFLTAFKISFGQRVTKFFADQFFSLAWMILAQSMQLRYQNAAQSVRNKLVAGIK